MNSLKSKSWKPSFFTRPIEYTSELPYFHDEKDFPELQILKDNWKEIRDEIILVEENQGKLKGHKTYNTPPINENKNWSNFYLDNFLWSSHKNKKLFPFTNSLIEKIPNCTLAAISILSPGGTVKPHYGDTDGIVRCHLGLIIPNSFPTCGIRVGTEEKGWQAGEIIVFTEAHLHEVWNESNKRRYILIVDIIPSYVDSTLYSLCSKTLGALSYIYFERKLTFLKKLPRSFVSIIHFFLSSIWRCYLPLQRKFKLP